MASKSLGQVAFEAWLNESVGPAHPEAWWPNAAPDHEAWQAAAEAVIHETQLERLRQIGAREIAVIEAVRNLVHGWRWTTDDGEEITVPPWDYYSQDLLTEKLRALDSEEE